MKENSEKMKSPASSSLEQKPATPARGLPKTAVGCLLTLFLVALLVASCDIEEEIRRLTQGTTTTTTSTTTTTTTSTTTTTTTTVPADPNAPVYEVPVISLAFLPLDPNGGERLARDIVGSDLPDSMLDLDVVRQKIRNQEDEYVELIKKSSRFRGYNDPTARPSIGYVVRERLEYTEEVPTLGSGNDQYFTDKNDYLSEINICNYVDNQGIREVWVYMYHNDGVAVPIESDMSMGFSIKESWTHSGYGDISNSYRRNNMPICRNTYTVYEFNYGRGTDTFQHNLGHQIESIMSHMDRSLFWNGFAGFPRGEGVNRCGSLHWAPGATGEYNSWETQEVMSDCATWNPGDPGQPELVNCRTWFAGECTPGDMIPFQTWWMQSLPGWNNGLLTEGGRPMRNWWDFIGDFDSAIKAGRSLTQPGS